MKRILFLLTLTVALSLVAGSAYAGPSPSSKYYVPSWDMPQGSITAFPKGHTATTEYIPDQITSYDKQHMPWFQSTLKPQNVRREGRSDLIEEAGKMFSGIFSKK